MNWVRNNRFLASFLAVVILGSAGLSFLLYNSLSRYQQVATDYDTQVKELQRLQVLEPYPDAASEKEYKEVRQKYATDVAKLQTMLASHEPKPQNPPPSPIQFQDKLRQVVEDVARLAQLKGVALPEGFYLGFEQYRGSPPDAAATPLLNTQLDAIQNIVSILINTKIDKLTAVRRAPLAQESGGAGAAPPTPGRPTAPGAPGAEDVSKQSLEIAFSAPPPSFRESLNNLTRDSQLYIVRALQVKNQVDKGPSREAANAKAADAAVAAATPAPTAPEPGGVPNPQLPEQGPPPLSYVVGLEHLDIVARIELPKVLPPAH